MAARLFLIECGASYYVSKQVVRAADEREARVQAQLGAHARRATVTELLADGEPGVVWEWESSR